MAWFWFTLSLTLTLFNEYLYKHYANTRELKFVFVIALLALLSILTWLQVLKERNELARMSLIWFSVCMPGTVAIGTLCFGETLTLTQWIGGVLAFIGMLMLV